MHSLLHSALLLSLVALSGCGLAWGDQLAQQPAGKPAAAAKPAPTQDTPPARQNPLPANNANRKPEDAKSPLVRSLLEQLNQFPAGDGTAEERSAIRDRLWGADEELARSMGPNAKKAILQANKRRPAFRIPTKEEREIYRKKKEGEKAVPKTGEPTPAVPPMPEVKPPVPAPMPVPMKKPATKPEDDPFGM